MDQHKMGNFIRMLRRERDMTQKDLAERLNITDRAISKWERGVCAPDIGLLELLAEVLGTTVPELIRGERDEHSHESEWQTQTVIDFSKRQIAHQVGAARRRYLLAAAAALLIVVLVAAVLLWQGGWFYVVAREPSPNGADVLTVYDRQLDSGFSTRRGTSFILRYADGASLRVNYGDCRFGGAWWSPDGTQFVMQLHYPQETRHVLLDGSSCQNLSFFLEDATRAAGLVADENAEMDFRFLQWSVDGSAMLFFYTCQRQDTAARSGYFWFHTATYTADAVLELREPS